MDKLPEKKTLKKRLAAFLPILTFGAAYLAFSPYGRDWIGKLTTTDADIRAKMEREVMNDSKMYQALKEHFPNEYETLVLSTIKDIRDGTKTEEASRRGAEFTADLRKKNAANFAMASVESLRADAKGVELEGTA